MPNWTKEQEQAIYESGKNIIVSAGAGSGKTAVLSERVLKKIENGVDKLRINPGNIGGEETISVI